MRNSCESGGSILAILQWNEVQGDRLVALVLCERRILALATNAEKHLCGAFTCNVIELLSIGFLTVALS